MTTNLLIYDNNKNKKTTKIIMTRKKTSMTMKLILRQLRQKNHYDNKETDMTTYDHTALPHFTTTVCQYGTVQKLI